jgi:hypothetical protein
MATRDIITDLTDLTLPLPEPPGDGDEPDGWSALREEVAEDREAYEQGLRLTCKHEDDYDPLLGEIAAARDAMLAAEARMRLLVAYGREFTRPRPYRLEDLARSAGMSISGVRTAYDDDEVAEVARLTGARPARRPPETP